MIRSLISRACVGALLVLAVLPSGLHAQVGVLGITDKNYGAYGDSATFVVTNETGYSYDARLDGSPVPVGVPITLRTIDYHELQVWRTNVATLAVTNQLVKFIVHNVARRAGGSTEDGISSWTPYPPINSTAGEFAGGQLRVIAPQNFPTGYPVPVVGWVENNQGHAIRAIGLMSAAGHPSIKMKRGVGSGFLGAGNPAGALAYAPAIGGLTTTSTINLEAGTVWTTVAGGNLPANTTWPANSRIQLTANITNLAGSTLTVGAGTVVRVNPNIDIANNGAVVMNGTTSQPVVWMATTTGSPWGGFIQHANNASFTATGAIFTGCGAVPCWFLGHGCSSSTSGIGSHRGEQALVSLNGINCNLTLTDCAAIFMAGQLSHSVGGGGKTYAITLTRFLMQRSTTGGEFTGAKFTVNDSAFIECNEDLATGEGPTFIDADNDGLYIVDAISGAHAFTNTLWGWTWDDGVDSGGSGAGRLNFQNCWFDSIYHEANSLSGTGKDSRHKDDVMINCGQAIECGYDSPTGRVDHCLAINNEIGVRFGDNYNYASPSYNGFQWASNTISLNNHRDVWGFDWLNWAYRASAMNIQSNFFSAANSIHPSNYVWNPATDATRLAPFLTTPPDANVGVGLATWTNQFPLTNLFLGVPVRLSTFSTNSVSVDYAFLDTNGVTLATGALTLVPGETVKNIFPSGFNIAAQNFVRVNLRNPVRGELTGATNVDFIGSVPAPQVACWISTNFLQGYRMAEGVLVRLTAPSALPVSVNYAYQAQPGVLASGTLNFAPGETVKQVLPVGVSTYPLVQMNLSSPSGASLTGITSVGYTNPPTIVSFSGTNLLNISALTNGLTVLLNNPAPVGGLTVNFTCEGNGFVLTNATLTLSQGQLSVPLTLPTVNPASFEAIRVSLNSPVHASLGAPATVFYLRTATLAAPNPTLIASNSAWRYLDTGVDSGTTWRPLSFNDLTWSNGVCQLGFGDGDEATVIRRTNSGGGVINTFYFRKTFVVSNAGAYTNLSMWMLRDDGGVVYLNNTEAYRSPSMPQSPTAITYTTPATNQSIATAPADNTVDTATLSTNLLINGTNVAAVEIHQHDNTSSDISFDFALTGNAAPVSILAAPVITAPTNTQSYGTGIVVAVTVSATNSYTNVVLYVDTVRFGQLAAGPFNFNLSGLSPGNHDLVAFASDASGLALASAPVTISVTAPLGLASSLSVANGLSIQFLALANTTYSVLYADVIPTNFWAKFQDIPAAPTNRAVTVTTTNAVAPQRFYKLVTPAQ